MSPGGLLLLQELSAESKKGAELHGAAQSGGGRRGTVRKRKWKSSRPNCSRCLVLIGLFYLCLSVLCVTLSALTFSPVLPILLSASDSQPHAAASRCH